MKLRNPNLHCGGSNGCGQEFMFDPEETVEDARVVFQAHRAAPEHAAAVKEFQNRIRLEQGLAPEA